MDLLWIVDFEQNKKGFLLFQNKMTGCWTLEERHCVLFHARSGFNATVAAKICDIYGEVLINKCQRWFRKFTNENLPMTC